jgi:hypothetical protein
MYVTVGVTFGLIPRTVRTALTPPVHCCDCHPSTTTPRATASPLTTLRSVPAVLGLDPLSARRSTALLKEYWATGRAKIVTKMGETGLKIDRRVIDLLDRAVDGGVAVSRWCLLFISLYSTFNLRKKITHHNPELTFRCFLFKNFPDECKKPVEWPLALTHGDFHAGNMLIGPKTEG